MKDTTWESLCNHLGINSRLETYVYSAITCTLGFSLRFNMQEIWKRKNIKPNKCIVEFYNSENLVI